MVPSSPQLAPPLGPLFEAIACGAPPSTRIFFSLSCAKNPTHVPSGEKKGLEAPSVPASGAAVNDESGRTYTRATPSWIATYATVRPSADSARLLALSSNVSVSGKVNCTSVGRRGAPGTAGFNV